MAQSRLHRTAGLPSDRDRYATRRDHLACVGESGLDGLETLLKKRYPRHKRMKVYLVRYADDFIITCSDRSVLEQEIQPLVERFMAERGLRLSPEKTVITHIDDGFDFLGVTIRKFGGKLIIKPSVKSQQAVLEKMRNVVKQEGKNLSAAGLIQRLNPILRGWGNYHRYVVAARTFARIDSRLYNILWGWARSRHRDKSRRWVFRRYFSDDRGRRQAFHAYTVDAEGQRRKAELVKLTRLPIRRHIKICGAANPYDPAWEPYFEQRRFRKTVDELPDRFKLRALWRLQRGICPALWGTHQPHQWLEHSPLALAGLRGRRRTGESCAAAS